MLKNIFNDSMSNLKKNWLMSIMLCVLAVLSAGIVFALAIVPWFGHFLTIFIIIPFVLIPIVFAMQAMHFGLRDGAAPSGSAFARFFKAYFAPGIMGVYRVINTMLFTMLAQIILLPIIASITYACSGTFQAVLNEIYEAQVAYQNALIAGGDDVEIYKNALIALYESTDFKNYVYISSIPSVCISCMIAFLSASFNSMSIYFKVKNPAVNPGMSNRIYTFAKNQIRGKLIGEYWALNWPIYLLFMGGFAGGICITYYCIDTTIDLSITFAPAIGIIFGILAMLLYLPFFVSNMESIYLSHHEEVFTKAPGMFAEKMQQAMNAQMGIMQAQMADLKRQQQDINNSQAASKDGEQTVVDGEPRVDNSKPHDNNENTVVDADVKDENSQNKL